MMIDPDALQEAIETAPAWAKVGLTLPQTQLREDACREVAAHLYRTLYSPASSHRDQLALPL